MENPEEDVANVIHLLTQGSRAEQEDTLNHYFLPNAYFVHPFCRVPSFQSGFINSRWLILLIYQWYKIQSPKIVLEVDSTSFDSRTNSLYAAIRQTWTLWFIPFDLWQANVKLVCLMELAHLPVGENDQPLIRPDGSAQPGHDDSKKLYFIRGQNDHYQVNEFIKFILPIGGFIVWYLVQLIATMISGIGALLFWPVTSVYEFLVERYPQRLAKAIQKKS